LLLSRYRRPLVGALLGIALVATAAAGADAQAPVTSAPYVKVFVDNQPVYFDQPPVIVMGRVLVPLRGVFERLGAIVAWDPTTQTVLAQRGDTGVALRIGAPQAMVNGQPAPMDVPAMLVGGRTMVPLRFVSQALGAQVFWNAATATVAIASQAAMGAPPARTYPASQPTAEGVTGTVLSVRAGVAPGRLIVQAGNAVYTYQVVPTTSIMRTNAATGAGGSVALSALRPGDEVQVAADQNGVARSIQATYAVVSGRLAAVTPRAIVLDNGSRYRLSASVEVIQSGTVVGMGALRAGEVVTLRLNPRTDDVWGVTLRGRAAGDSGATPVATAPPAITSPVTGTTINIPFTVTGRAAPGTRIRVTAGYAGTVLLFNVNGSLGTQTVVADENGNWQATFGQALTVRGGVTLTITAVAVDSAGNPISPESSVTATLQ
jgi:hypothetical protein